MARAAYVVMSHKLPEQLVRLTRTLRALSAEAAILVHHDARHTPLPAAELAAVGGVTVLPAAAVTWGRGSQLDMLLGVLRGALAEPKVDWIFLLSGQDYPLRPLSEVEAELRAAPHDGYLEDRTVAAPSWTSREVEQFAQRYYYAWRAGAGTQYCPLPRFAQAARPLTLARQLPIGTLLGRRRLRTPFNAKRPLRVGSDWLTLSAPAARRLTDLDQRPDGRRLHRYFRATIAPTEALPHTVLWAEPNLALSGDTRRYMAWDSGAAHPRMLGVTDLDDALASGADFARKFDSGDPDAAAALDRLDAHLGLR